MEHFRYRSNRLVNKLYDPKKLKIVLGNIYRTRPFKTMLHRDVGKITIHKNFTANGDFDVAVLRMVNALPSTSVGIAPIKLRSTSLSPNVSCTISGWGEYSEQVREYSDHLLFSSVQVLANTDCNSVWGGTLPSGMACIGGEQKRVCNGDLGAPVVCGRELAGFVSRDTTCSTRPTLITNVAAYKSWLDKNGSWAVTVNYLLITVGVIVQLIRMETV